MEERKGAASEGGCYTRSSTTSHQPSQNHPPPTTSQLSPALPLTLGVSHATEDEGIVVAFVQRQNSLSRFI